MRNIRQFCAAVILTFMLVLSAFAGDMHAPGVTAQGIMQTPGVVASGDMQFPSATADPLTDVLLGFLLNAASLF